MSLWDELEGKLHDDGTYHVERKLMFEIVEQLERFRRSEASGCIIPNLPGLSQVTATYGKTDSPVRSNKKKSPSADARN